MNSLKPYIYKLYPDVRGMGDENLEDWYDALSQKSQDEILTLKCKAEGLEKKNYILCIEVGRVNTNEMDMHTFDSIYDFEYSWWEFQKEDRLSILDEYNENIKSGKNNPSASRYLSFLKFVQERYTTFNHLEMSGEYFWGIDNGQFKRFSLTSLEYHIFDDLVEYIDDLMEELIPRKFKDDLPLSVYLNNSQPMFDANGREEEFTNLQNITFAFQNEVIKKRVLEELEKIKEYASGKVFIHKYTSTKIDMDDEIIFVDLESAKNIKTDDFFNNLRKYSMSEKEYEKIEHTIVELKAELKERFVKIYELNKKKFTQGVKPICGIKNS